MRPGSALRAHRRRPRRLARAGGARRRAQPLLRARLPAPRRRSRFAEADAGLLVLEDGERVVGALPVVGRVAARRPCRCSAPGSTPTLPRHPAGRSRPPRRASPPRCRRVARGPRARVASSALADRAPTAPSSAAIRGGRRGRGAAARSSTRRPPSAPRSSAGPSADYLVRDQAPATGARWTGCAAGSARSSAARAGGDRRPRRRPRRGRRLPPPRGRRLEGPRGDRDGRRGARPALLPGDVRRLRRRRAACSCSPSRPAAGRRR